MSLRFFYTRLLTFPREQLYKGWQFSHPSHPVSMPSVPPHLPLPPSLQSVHQSVSQCFRAVGSLAACLPLHHWPSLFISFPSYTIPFFFHPSILSFLHLFISSPSPSGWHLLPPFSLFLILPLLLNDLYPCTLCLVSIIDLALYLSLPACPRIPLTSAVLDDKPPQTCWLSCKVAAVVPKFSKGGEEHITHTLWLAGRWLGCSAGEEWKVAWMW